MLIKYTPSRPPHCLSNYSPQLILRLLPSLWLFNIINLKPPRSTRETFPIKIFRRITMAFRSKYVFARTMMKWNLYTMSANLKSGEGHTWKYPISLKKWISFLGRKRDAAMEWTGASPQRYISDGFLKGLERGGGTS